MVAEQADGCPQDFEPIFYRVWNGTKDFCSDGEVESCNGEMVKGIPPINMTSFSGKVACGKRGGPSFINSRRVGAYTWTCPDGFVPCSLTTLPTETVCIEPDKKPADCPILDFIVIHEEAARSYQNIGYSVTEDGYLQDAGYYTKIAFSKNNARQQVSAEPIISTAMNTRTPCIGYDRDRLILT